MIVLICRNAEKTAAKVEDIENSIKENKQKLESLENEMKHVEVAATNVLAELEKAKVKHMS